MHRMNNKHDPNGPSKLDRRYYCPGSFNLENQEGAQLSSDDSEEARIGTLKHKAVYAHLDPENWERNEYHDSEDVLWCVEAVREEIDRRPGCIVLKERPLDLTTLGMKKPGTPDILLIVPAVEIVDIDLKFGHAWIERPGSNLQFLSYSWGAWLEFGGQYVTAIKLQPNIERYQHTSDILTPDDLKAGRDRILQVIENTKVPDAPLCRGSHCRYCKGKDLCPLWRGTVLEIPRHLTIHDHVRSVSPSKRRRLYEDLQACHKWCKAAIGQIETYALSGDGVIEGYEVGEGNCKRSWTNPDSVYSILRGMAIDKEIDPDTMIKTELISPHEAEKVYGKSKAIREMLEPWILKTPGKPAIKKARGHLKKMFI